MERSGTHVTLESKNKLKADASEVESNGIGLKTCVRLSRFISEGFHYEEQNGYFISRLTLKLYAEAK